jgi:hypothetical protein
MLVGTVSVGAGLVQVNVDLFGIIGTYLYSFPSIAFTKQTGRSFGVLAVVGFDLSAYWHGRKKSGVSKVCPRAAMSCLLQISYVHNYSPRFSFTAEEQKAFQVQHGEKYIQLKNYTDQLEAELRETKAKMQALTTSNDELREVSSLFT